MTHKLYLGFSIFIILIIGVTVFQVSKISKEIHQMRDDFTRVNTPLENPKTQKKEVQQLTEVKTQPKKDETDQIGHYHEDGKWCNEIHEDEIVVSIDLSVTEDFFPRPEFPVRALREFLKKRGHWSAKWIPDFPPDDKEASLMAYFYHVIILHREKRDPNNVYDDGPALIPAIETNDMLKRYKYEETERAYDMYKLSWSILESPPVSNPESFNVHGFDEAAFEKERIESLEAAEKASEEKAIRKRVFQENHERSVDQLIKEISEGENR